MFKIKKASKNYFITSSIKLIIYLCLEIKFNSIIISVC